MLSTIWPLLKSAILAMANSGQLWQPHGKFWTGSVDRLGSCLIDGTVFSGLLADWYDNGHLRICLPEDTIGPPTGNYRPPEKTSDLDTPPYWCALQENRAAKSHGLPPPNVSVEYQRTHELDKSNCYSMNSTLRTPYIPKRTSLSNDNKIINLLGDDECPGTYEAIKGSWWSNDILSHVVYRTLLPILSWLTSIDVRRIAQLPPYTWME